MEVRREKQLRERKSFKMAMIEDPVKQVEDVTASLRRNKLNAVADQCQKLTATLASDPECDVLLVAVGLRYVD